MHHITGISKTFTIHRRDPSHHQTNSHLYEVLDSHKSLTYKIKIQCEGLCKKRAVAVQDTHGRALLTITTVMHSFHYPIYILNSSISTSTSLPNQVTSFLSSIKHRRGFLNRLEHSIGDDGGFYDRKPHVFRKDECSLEVPMDGRRETFLFEHKPIGFSGLVHQVSTGHAVASIQGKFTPPNLVSIIDLLLQKPPLQWSLSSKHCS